MFQASNQVAKSRRQVIRYIELKLAPSGKQVASRFSRSYGSNNRALARATSKLRPIPHLHSPRRIDQHAVVALFDRLLNGLPRHRRRVLRVTWTWIGHCRYSSEGGSRSTHLMSPRARSSRGSGSEKTITSAVRQNTNIGVESDPVRVLAQTCRNVDLHAGLTPPQRRRSRSPTHKKHSSLKRTTPQQRHGKLQHRHMKQG